MKLLGNLACYAFCFVTSLALDEAPQNEAFSMKRVDETACYVLVRDVFFLQEADAFRCYSLMNDDEEQ